MVKVRVRVRVRVGVRHRCRRRGRMVKVRVRVRVGVRHRCRRRRCMVVKVPITAARGHFEGEGEVRQEHAVTERSAPAAMPPQGGGSGGSGWLPDTPRERSGQALAARLPEP